MNHTNSLFFREFDYRLMEMTQEERFHEEKEKIVQILEAGFAQRERLSLEKREDDLRQKFEKSVEEQKIKWEEEKSKALAMVKKEQQFDFEEKLSQMNKAQKMNIELMIQKATEEMKQKFDEDRDSALKQQNLQSCGIQNLVQGLREYAASNLAYH